MHYFKRVFWGVFCLAVAACASTGPYHEGEVTGRPATSPAGDTELIADCGSLVPIRASSTQIGIAREYKWIEEAYPGATVRGQASSDCDGTPVDVIQIQTARGEIRNISFDTSNFFGKVGGKDLDDLLDG